MAAAGAAVIKIGKDAIASFAEYEQLVGGVETLFKKSSDKVLQYAQNAYKTAGLSANRYMETVTSFSASLLQSLGGDTQKAADYADMAVKDMSDNANKMGTDMETIIATYQSLSRGNYAMLDNLKLGYGGTKEEMERLIADAAKLDSSVKANDMSFGNLTKAIHAVQNEMGITGTTAKEASSTIQGSAASMKAAWQNLLTAFADPSQNLDAVLGQFVDSVVVFGENLIPRIQMLLPRLVTGLSQLAQALAVQLPQIIQTLLPALIQGAVGVVGALIVNLPQILQSLITAIVTVFRGFGAQLQQSGGEMLDRIVSGLQNGLPKILNKAVEIVLKVVDGITKNLPKILAVAGEIIGSLITGIVKFLPKLAAKVPDIISTIVKVIGSLLSSIVTLGVSVMKSFISGITSWIGNLGKKALSVGKKAVSSIKSGISGIADVGLNLVKGLWNGISNAKDWVLGKIKGFGESILNGLKDFFGIHSPSRVMETVIGKNLALGVANGITKNSKYAKKSAAEMAQVVLDAAQKRLDKYKVYNDMSIEAEVAYWDTIRRECKKGTDARLQADQNYFAAKAALDAQYITDSEEILNQLKRLYDLSAADEVQYWAEIAAAAKKGTDARIAAEEKYQAALDNYYKEYESYVQNVMGQMDLFKEYVQNEAVSPDSLVTNLQSQIGGLESYYQTMAELQNKIGGTALYDYLADLGVDHLSELQAVNGMADQQLQQYVELYNQKYELAQKIATEKLGEITTITDIEQKKANKTTDKNMKTMADTLKKYAATMSDTTKKKFSEIYSTISSKMSASVSAVRSAVAQMQAALAEMNSMQAEANSKADAAKNPTDKKTTTSKTTSKKTTVKKHALGGILTEPTIFGFTPSTGTYHLGGEAGKEAVAPISTLQKYVRESVAEENAGIAVLLARMIELLEGLLDKDTAVYLNSKEISKAVNKDLGVLV